MRFLGMKNLDEKSEVLERVMLDAELVSPPPPSLSMPLSPFLPPSLSPCFSLSLSVYLFSRQWMSRLYPE